MVAGNAKAKRECQHNSGQSVDVLYTLRFPCLLCDGDPFPPALYSAIILEFKHLLFVRTDDEKSRKRHSSLQCVIHKTYSIVWTWQLKLGIRTIIAQGFVSRASTCADSDWNCNPCESTQLTQPEGLLRRQTSWSSHGDR